MAMDGRCYCGALTYKSEGDVLFRAQCHCRECQYVSGGGPNFAVGVPEDGFSYTKGAPKTFKRADLEAPVAREFCVECGTHIGSRPPGMPGVVILKVGTLEDPSVFGQPQMAIFTCDKQSFHHIPDGVPAYDRVPD